MSSYLNVSVMFGQLAVTVWSNEDCTADLTRQAEFRLSHIAGIETDCDGKMETLTIHTVGGPVSFRALPNPAYYDQVNEAMHAMAQVRSRADV